jgi:hypothetical protein
MAGSPGESCDEDHSTDDLEKIFISMIRRREAFESVTMGHIRAHGCRDLLIYCNSGRCHHGGAMNGDHLPDETAVRSLGARMVCTRCGHIGADVRPDWSPHVNRRPA